jgi:hypothetical protein
VTDEVAEAFHRKQVLYRNGIAPWKQFCLQKFEKLERSVLNETTYESELLRIADRHYAHNLLLQTFNGILQFYVDEQSREEEVRITMELLQL